MIALDTDIVLRALLDDDPKQSAGARKVWLDARKRQTALYISDIVLVDVAWALESRHGLTRAQIAAVFGQLLETELVVVSDTAVIDRAVNAFSKGKAGFADYLIREQAVAAGATKVVTFDEAFAGEQGFEVRA
jgi:predicted nucleic-acid-binding protein